MTRRELMRTRMDKVIAMCKEAGISVVNTAAVEHMTKADLIDLLLKAEAEQTAPAEQTEPSADSAPAEPQSAESAPAEQSEPAEPQTEPSAEQTADSAPAEQTAPAIDFESTGTISDKVIAAGNAISKLPNITLHGDAKKHKLMVRYNKKLIGKVFAQSKDTYKLNLHPKYEAAFSDYSDRVFTQNGFNCKLAVKGLSLDEVLTLLKKVVTLADTAAAAKKAEPAAEQSEPQSAEQTAPAEQSEPAAEQSAEQ